MKNVSVKYCGGCNPRFDRVAFTARFFDTFPQLAAVGADSPDPWFAIGVCGCERACIKSSQFRGHEGNAIICDMSAFDNLCERISYLLSDKEG